MHCKASAPVSAHARSDPTRKGTAESQASTMPPIRYLASPSHTGCDALSRHVRLGVMLQYSPIRLA